jgi:hypothetical protein
MLGQSFIKLLCNYDVIIEINRHDELCITVPIHRNYFEKAIFFLAKKLHKAHI